MPAWAGLIAGVVILAGPAQAQSIENSVKASFLARFAAFVQWPPNSFSSASSPITLCVVGADPFDENLDQAIANQTVNGRRIVARRLARLQDGSGCHIAYLAGSSDQSVADALAVAGGDGILTVTDEARGSQRGVIHFAVFQSRVRFHVDAGQAAGQRLTVSSRLLSLALSVRET